MAVYDLQTSSDFINQFWTIVAASQRVLITSHKGPDDDSFSAVSSLITIIHSAYPEKTVKGAYSGEFRNRWTTFEHALEIEGVDDIAQIADEYDVVIVLDVGTYDRFCKDGEKFAQYTGKTICIDHHASPKDTFDLTFVDSSTTSTAELLYTLFCDEKLLENKALCESLLLGILGDTGWFGVQMGPNHAYILSIAQVLMEKGGIDLELFKQRFRGYSEKVFYVIQELTKNVRFESIGDWPRFMYSYLSREFAATVDELDAKEGCDIFVGMFAKTLSDIGWGFILSPSANGDVKVSLRSKPGSVDVRAWAESMELGGGHQGASGMKFSAQDGETLDPQKQAFVLFEWMKTHEYPKYNH